MYNVVQPPLLSNSKEFSSPQNKTPYPLSGYSLFLHQPSAILYKTNEAISTQKMVHSEAYQLDVINCYKLNIL